MLKLTSLSKLGAMRRASVRGPLIRGMLFTSVIAVSCNSILGNEERTFVPSTGGNESGSGGADSTTGSGGTSSGGSGGGGTAADSGGAASTGEAGEAGAAGAGQAGAAGESSGTGTGGAASATSASGGASASGGTSAAGGTSTTGVACECTPGNSSSRDVTCGNCGTATKTRLCKEDCQWGQFDDPGECMNQGVCAPGTPETVIGHCTNGRWRDRTRTCSDTCEWGAWVEGECEGNGDNCTGCACVSWCTDPDTGGTTCKWIDCSESEARAECEADIVSVGCTRKEPLTFLEWLPD